MDVPADIRETVDAIFDNVAADESVADAVARALMAERERAAKIAEDWEPEEKYQPGDHYEAGLCDAGERIAAVIRA